MATFDAEYVLCLEPVLIRGPDWSTSFLPKSRLCACAIR